MHGYKWPINCTRTRMHIVAEGDVRSQEAPPADRSVHAMAAARRLGVEDEFTRAKASLAALQGDAPPSTGAFPYHP